MKIKIKRLYPGAIIPTRAKSSDAGYDLYAGETRVIGPMDRLVISTGICVEIPEGYYGRVAPRSGLAIKEGIDVLGGVIDSGYRSDIGVILINLNLPDIVNASKYAKAHQVLFGQRNRMQIEKGDRIAQLIIEKCHDIEFEEVEALSESERGESGFGSSGS